MASNNNIHRRPDSAVHHTGDDYVLGNLKFVPKSESVEVFGMAIPDPLITEAIQQSSYYPKYLEMVAENTKKTPQESARNLPSVSFHIKLERESPLSNLLTKMMKLNKNLFVKKKREEEGDDADLERAIKLSLDPAFLPQGWAPVGGVTIKDPVSETTSKLHEVVGKRKAVVTEEQVAHSLIDLSKKKRGKPPKKVQACNLQQSVLHPKSLREGEGDDADLERAIKLSLDPAFLPQGRAPVEGVTIRDPVSETTSKLHEVVGKGKAVVTEELHEVVGKGKAVVTEEQVAHSLIDLSKKKRTTDQFILVRRDQTPPDSTTGPSSQP
ncbi:retrovirus-related pol polyprotein from transposon TNT 1-94, partial [Tanacetum coccineum]